MPQKYLSGFIFLLLFGLILFNPQSQRYRIHGEENRAAQTSPKPTSNDSKSILSSTIPSNVGQWLLYKVDLKNDHTNKAASFTMKISLVSKEIINKQTYFWKEVNIPTLGVIIKRLTNSTTGKVKKCIFQRRGDQPIEFDIAELSRQLGKPENTLA